MPASPPHIEALPVASLALQWNGIPRGFAFVTYRDPSVLVGVLAATHKIDGRIVEVKRALPRDGARDRTPPSATRLDLRKVFVGGLASTVREPDLRSHFAGRGWEVVDAAVMMDRDTRRCVRATLRVSSDKPPIEGN